MNNINQNAIDSITESDNFNIKHNVDSFEFITKKSVYGEKIKKININFALFAANQDYHTQLQYDSAPYDTIYYGLMNEYLKQHNATEIILLNFFSKLYCFTYGDVHVFKMINEFVKYFKNIKMTNELFYKIFLHIKGSYDSYKKTHKEKFTDESVITRSLYAIEKLLDGLDNNILTLDDFYNNIKTIDWCKQTKYSKRDKTKYGDIDTIDFAKLIFEKIYEKNQNHILHPDTIQYIFKYDMIKNYKIQNVNEYRLLFKYYKKLNLNKNFPFDIECLENACHIVDNDVVVKRIMKTVQPTLQCLDFALKYQNNSVSLILLDVLQPTNEQLKNYSLLKQDEVLTKLVDKVIGN